MKCASGRESDHRVNKNTARLRVPCLLLALMLMAGVVAPVSPQPVNPSPATPEAAAPKAKGEAAAADQAKPQPEKKKEDERVFIEHADEFRYDPDTKTYHMRGNVVMLHKDMKLHCDVGEYNEDADTARATGRLRVTDPESVITGDLLEADFDKEVVVITGNVTVVTQKKPPQKVQREVPGGTLAADKSRPKRTPAPPNGLNPKGEVSEPNEADKTISDKEPRNFEAYREKRTTITCERLEYEYNEDVKRMTATPRVKAVQEKRTLFADQALFDDVERLVTLTGNVLVQNDKGDEMRCAKAVIHMDDDWLKAENMSGVTLRKKKEPAPPAPTPAASKPEGEATAPPAEATPAAPVTPAEAAARDQ
jgi:lipopolysaccharide assembly outer membrane protein LptD (OstA)